MENEPDYLEDSDIPAEDELIPLESSDSLNSPRREAVGETDSVEVEVPRPEETSEYLEDKMDTAIAPASRMLTENAMSSCLINVTELDSDDVDYIRGQEATGDPPTAETVIYTALASVSLGMQMSEKILQGELPENITRPGDLATMEAAIKASQELGVRFYSAGGFYRRALGQRIHRTNMFLEGLPKDTIADAEDSFINSVFVRMEMSVEKLRRAQGIVDTSESDVDIADVIAEDTEPQLAHKPYGGQVEAGVGEAASEYEDAPIPTEKPAEERAAEASTPARADIEETEEILQGIGI